MVLIDEYQFRLMLEILTAMGLEGEKNDARQAATCPDPQPEPAKHEPERKKTT